MRIDNIFSNIDRLIKAKSPVLVAIDGNSGAGKTSLANIIAEKYNCNIFHMDHFFLTAELRTDTRLKEAGGNVDYQRFKEEVINGILSQTDLEYKKYNCKTQQFSPAIKVPAKKLNIIEGSYSMHPTLINYYDLKIFLTVDKSLQEKIISKRDGTEMLKRFVEEWIPKENTYFEKTNIKQKSDLIYQRTHDSLIEITN